MTPDTRHSLHGVGERTLRFLDPTLQHLHSSSKLSGPAACAFWCTLPPGCLTTICCITCEVFCYQRPKKADKEAVNYKIVRLAAAMGAATTAYRNLHPDVPLPQHLTSIASLELAKLAVSCGNKISSGNELAADQLLAYLNLLLLLHPPQGSSSGSKLHPGSTVSLFDADQPRIRTSNLRLLLHLRALAVLHDGSLEGCTQAMLTVTGMLVAQNTSAASTDQEILAALPICLHHCATHLSKAMPVAQGGTCLVSHSAATRAASSVTGLKAGPQLHSLLLWALDTPTISRNRTGRNFQR